TIDVFRSPEGDLAESVERSRVEDLPPPTLSAVTDDGGAAEFRLPPGAAWVVVASAKGRARVAQTRLSTSQEGEYVMSLVVPPARRRTGRVLDEDGKPVPPAVAAARRAVAIIGFCATCDPPAFASALWTRADADDAGR